MCTRRRRRHPGCACHATFTERCKAAPGRPGPAQPTGPSSDPRRSCRWAHPLCAAHPIVPYHSPQRARRLTGRRRGPTRPRSMRPPPGSLPAASAAAQWRPHCLSHCLQSAHMACAQPSAPHPTTGRTRTHGRAPINAARTRSLGERWRGRGRWGRAARPRHGRAHATARAQAPSARGCDRAARARAAPTPAQHTRRAAQGTSLQSGGARALGFLGRLHPGAPHPGGLTPEGPPRLGKGGRRGRAPLAGHCEGAGWWRRTRSPRSWAKAWARAGFGGKDGWARGWGIGMSEKGGSGETNSHAARAG
jgi:hypothetical protein